jgi:hypothetical protein
MIFAIFLPGYWTPSNSAQHVFISVLYAAGLICIGPIRSRHRFDYLEDAYSLSEALLWLGIYLIFNLKISALSLPSQWVGQHAGRLGIRCPVLLDDGVLIWCLPPLILARGVVRRIASSSRSARLLPSSPLSATNCILAGSGIPGTRYFSV